MKNQEHEDFVGRKIKNYSFLREIGSGNYGQVYCVYEEERGYNYAAKVVPKILLRKTPKLMELLKSQIKVLKQCKNENVVGYIDNFTTDRHIILIMELCDGGELQQYIISKKRLTEQQATYFLKQIINGFKGLHEVKAMHRDFKAANVLLHRNVCKIADLGFSIQMINLEEDLTTTVLGTSVYMAPQVLQQKAYGRKADIWSIGVVYYQMIYGEYPYNGFNDRQILKLIQTTRPNYSKVNISNNAKNFLEKCFTVNPKDRINWIQIYKHPLFHEDQMAVSLCSSIRLHKNQKLYSQQESNNSLVISEVDLSQLNSDLVIESATIDIESKVKDLQINKKISNAIILYEKMYLNRWNKIMFIYKHINPFITDLFKKIKANHSINIFLICKNCCLQMKEFGNYLNKDTNFLNIGQYWQTFIKSPSYSSIKEMIASSLFLSELQTTQYKSSVPKAVNDQIKSQLDIYQVSHKNWREFYLIQIEKYLFELIERMNQLNGQLKVKLIRLIVSLIYIREMKQSDELQTFQRKIENIMDYQLLEKELYGILEQRLLSICKK